MNTNSLIFCGNSSIDRIVTKQSTVNIIGGSACNSAIAAVLSGHKNISLISSIGQDFPIGEIENLGINTEYLQHHKEKSNTFIIDDENKRISMLNPTYLPIKIPDNLRTEHLHVSCRKGVPFIEAMTKIKANHYSVDVMWSSLKDFSSDISSLLKKVDYLFCNDTEFLMMQQSGVFDNLPQNLTIFTTDKTGVSYRKGKSVRHISTIDINPVVSTVGAGDTFLGAFLSSFNKNNLDDAVHKALSMASISIKDYGNLHLKDKKEEIIRTEETIRKMDERYDTRINFYNRSIMQR